MAAAPFATLTLLGLLMMAACSAAADSPDPLIRMPTMDDDLTGPRPPRPAQLTRLQFYFHEVRTGAPNETSVLVASLNRPGSTFGDLKVFDNALRVGVDPSSRLIGRARGLGVTASMDNSGALTTIEFVFSDYDKYTGSTMATVGHFVMTDTAERSIVGGTGVLRFARGYFTTKIVVFTDVYLVALIDMCFTTAL